MGAIHEPGSVIGYLLAEEGADSLGRTHPKYESQSQDSFRIWQQGKGSECKPEQRVAVVSVTGSKLSQALGSQISVALATSSACK